MSILSDSVIKLINDIADKNQITNFKVTAELRAFTGDNFLGEIVKVNVNGICDERQTHLPLIVKKSTDNQEARRCMHIEEYFKIETFVYTQILPAFGQLQDKYNLLTQERLHYPKFYNASLQKFNEVVILGDLTYDGFVMYERRKPLDYQHTVLGIQNLARLHALSFVMKEQNPILYEMLINNIPHTENYGNFTPDITECCIKKLIPVMRVDKHKRKLEEIHGNVKKLFEECLDASNTHPYNVICHGDPHRHNFMFKYKDSHVTDLMLVDWQLARLASPATDISYLICLTTDQELRQTHLSSLFDLYYETLSNNLAKMGCDIQQCYPRHIFDQHLKDVFKFGISFALMIIMFILKRPGEERKIEEISDDMKGGGVDAEVHEDIIERIEGLLIDFMNLGYI